MMWLLLADNRYHNEDTYTVTENSREVSLEVNGEKA
jgi:hypothetical protein